MVLRVADEVNIAICLSALARAAVSWEWQLEVGVEAEGDVESSQSTLIKSIEKVLKMVDDVT